ncbi:sugar transferase [Nonomuraea cavernae]|uniref:Exopolysaccharide biosynthesis polyprenyl glycosylphosphotransferase n=1 Tax=Nonomuraea cavernae TaxID=2045107 RepID=A0A917YYK8_9ACTN|nr:sugar transferase [Nonomuraea cavernae]GGO70219.1 exopolysaccharide biosynthesis polyprenyl glycosylphosphotransferase [Nonomuraea cavernae]
MGIVFEEARAEARRLSGVTVWSQRYVRMVVVGDILCGLLGLGGVVVARQLLGYIAPWEIVLSASIAAVWPLVVRLTGGYDVRSLGEGAEEYRSILRGVAMLASSVAIIAYATQTPVARGIVMIGIPLAGLANLIFRYAMRKHLHRQRYDGVCMRRVVVVGHWVSVLELHRSFSRKPHHGMKIVAACVPTPNQATLPSQFDGFPVMGDFSNVHEVVRSVDADTVAVLSCPEFDGTALRRLAWRLEEAGTDLYVASALMEVAGPRINIRPVAGLPLLHVAHPDLNGARQAIKAVFDRIVALVSMLTLVPVLFAVFVAIRFTSRGPALFRQTRVGKDGREFVIYKFRTMVQDAERSRCELAGLDEGNGVLFKIRNDPRITRIGAMLRRYSVDELPQLLNVLRGDMSLVGPRPPLPEEVQKYGDDVRRRLLVKPGITGLWQVSGRSDLSWEESVRLDLRYVENWSLILDLQILWKTWSTVLRGTGAY